MFAGNEGVCGAQGHLFAMAVMHHAAAVANNRPWRRKNVVCYTQFSVHLKTIQVVGVAAAIVKIAVASTMVVGWNGLTMMHSLSGLILPVR